MDEFLAQVFLNNTVKQWLVSAAFILGGFGAGKVCSLVMQAVLNYLCRKTHTDLDDILVSVLQRPLGIAIALLGTGIGVKGLRVHPAADLWINRSLESLVIAIIAWGAARLSDALVLQLVPVRGLVQGQGPMGDREADIQPLLRKFCGAVIWLIAAALILRTMGYNISALIAGLGLGGAALALASKDTLSNFFGSITVFVDRPFRLHDRIKIGVYDGVITDMGVRTSKLKTLENRTVFIPNSLFATNPIENISAAPNIRVVQTLNLKGDNGPDKIEAALNILRDIGSTLPGLVDQPQAALVSIGGLVCQVSFAYFVSRQADYTETVSRVNLGILRRFAEGGITLG
ncbi:MAG: mechanosensitive ion channel family protein [Treponema sp.]|jgi:MscS family membrane protein|nr:mechanosensitive ion channel family protein [Treponema sp.]